MKIEQSRLGLQERDIEDCLFAHPELFGDGTRWIKRQFAVPSGINERASQSQDSEESSEVREAEQILDGTEI